MQRKLILKEVLRRVDLTHPILILILQIRKNLILLREKLMQRSIPRVKPMLRLMPKEKLILRNLILKEALRRVVLILVLNLIRKIQKVKEMQRVE